MLTIRSSDAGLLEVEATYSPQGSPPPNHLHPAQDERFEVLEGAMEVQVGGEERRLAAGEAIEIPRETPHQMWNAGDVPARVRWETRPAGRTEEWFRLLDSLQDRDEAAPPPDFGALLAEYEDVFQLAPETG